MEWKDKAAMVKIVNSRDSEALKSFLESHSEDFDAQAIDILANAASINNEVVQKFFFDNRSLIESFSDDISTRALIRIELFIEEFKCRLQKENVVS